MTAIGVMMYRLEKVSLNMLMEIFSKGFSKMTKWKETESSNTKMEKFKKAFGKIIN